MDRTGDIGLFETDSGDYEILAEGAVQAPSTGLFLEVGLRRGGGMKVILDGIMRRDIPATAVSVDCYGHMPYMVREGYRDDFDYTNEMRNETLSGIYEYIRGSSVNFLFFNMTDTQFFSRFADGVPIYVGKEELVIRYYSLVHLDGQHTLASVLKATQFFHNRLVRGGLLCYDDVFAYDHGAIERVLFANGYERLYIGANKGLYRWNG